MSALDDRAVTTPTAEERQVADAIRGAATPMLRADPQAVHFPTLAKAALSVMEHLPRIPRWRGRRVLVGVLDAVDVSVDLGTTTESGPSDLVLVNMRIEDETASLVLRPDEARPFFLAGLAACAAVDDPTMIDPSCDSTETPVTLNDDDDTATEREDPR